MRKRRKNYLRKNNNNQWSISFLRHSPHISRPKLSTAKIDSENRQVPSNSTHSLSGCSFVPISLSLFLCPPAFVCIKISVPWNNNIWMKMMIMLERNPQSIEKYLIEDYEIRYNCIKISLDMLSFGSPQTLAKHIMPVYIDRIKSKEAAAPLIILFTYDYSVSANLFAHFSSCFPWKSISTRRARLFETI